jgi:hypothetical protein
MRCGPRVGRRVEQAGEVLANAVLPELGMREHPRPCPATHSVLPNGPTLLDRTGLDAMVHVRGAADGAFDENEWLAVESGAAAFHGGVTAAHRGGDSPSSCSSKHSGLAQWPLAMPSGCMRTSPQCLQRGLSSIKERVLEVL